MQEINSKSTKRLIIEGIVNGKAANFLNSESWLDVRDLYGEIWKPIKGYEQRYLVSNYGRVKRLSYTQKGKGGCLIVMKDMIMKQSSARHNYAKVTLCFNGYTKTPQVHRLVAEAFIPNPDNYPQINHKDENKWNNCVENLEWCTAEYNIHYGTKLKRQGETFKKNGKRSKPIIQYSKSGEIIMIHSSMRDAARYIRKDNSRDGRERFNIKQCCNGETKSAYNYIWRYSYDTN